MLAGRRDRSRGVRGIARGAAIDGDAHPRPRRLPPRPGALHRQRLRDHRLRGRARAARCASGGSSARRSRDVAGMLRSFDYAATRRCCGAGGTRRSDPQDVPTLAPWARVLDAVGAARPSCGPTCETVGDAPFLPRTPRERLARCSTSMLLEKALYELGYELNNRPDWVEIPLARHPAQASLPERMSVSRDGRTRPRRRPSRTQTPLARPPSRARPTLLTDHDLYLFNEGTHSGLYEKLGAHPTDRRRRRPGRSSPSGRRTPSTVSRRSATSTAGTGDATRCARVGTVRHLGGLRAGRRHGARYKYHIALALQRLRGRQGRPVRASTHEVPPATRRRSSGTLDYEWGDAEWMATRASGNALDAPHRRSTRCTSARGGACPRRATAR